jgi:TonB family protein
MFESSLIDLEAKQHPRRSKWAPLPIAIALHGLVLASIGAAQVWNVASVGDPEVVTPFRVSFVPALQSAPAVSRPVQKAANTQKPVAPSKPVQPDLREIPDVPAPPSVQERTDWSDFPDLPQKGEQGNGDPNDGPWLLDGLVSNDHKVASVPVAAPVKDEILTVGGAVTRPVLRSGPPPRYTKVAQRARIQGTVVLQAVIDERGKVAEVRILKGLPMGLDQEAVDTVQDWTFEPAKLGGRPVKVYYTLTVQFQLDR